MKNITERFTVTLNERQRDMIEQITEESGIDGVANVLRHCLAIYHYDKYESKRYRSSVKPKEPDPAESMTFPQLCEYVGGEVVGAECTIIISDPEMPETGIRYRWSNSVLRNKFYPMWLKNSRSWEGIL